MVFLTFRFLRRQRERWQAQGQREPLLERQRLERRQPQSGGRAATHKFLPLSFSGGVLFPIPSATHPTSAQLLGVVHSK